MNPRTEPVLINAVKMTTTRVALQKGLAAIYFIAFLIAAEQGLALLGTHGIYPIPRFTQAVRFWDSPSLFYFYYSDGFWLGCTWLGVALALLAFWAGYERRMPWLTPVIWAVMWILYLSVVNVGQLFYGYGWEVLLLEAGFLAVFLGPSSSRVPILVIWLYRWLVFRIMFGAGLIKMRGDECWRDLTCLLFHYQTQPLPNPLSVFFHQLPVPIEKMSVLFNHFVELVVPVFLMGPRGLRTPAALITIMFQVVLVLSGNLSWLNYVTIVCLFACLDDRFWSHVCFWRRSSPFARAAFTPLNAVIFVIMGLLSIRPTLNLFSDNQIMNGSFEPFHLVNTYGAFGSVTRERREIILEGTTDRQIYPETHWLPYEFKCKPGDINRMPCVVSPYHYKIDWQMWFAAMSDINNNPWMLEMVDKLLDSDERMLSLLAGDPFHGQRPRFIRARLFKYEFTQTCSLVGSDVEKGSYWCRQFLGDYFPPLAK